MERKNCCQLRSVLNCCSHGRNKLIRTEVRGEVTKATITDVPIRYAHK